MPPASPPATRSSHLIAIQALLGLGTLAVVVLMPPARGAMMIVPFDAGGRDAMLTLAATDARLLGPGPLPHSLIVEGDRGPVARAAWRHDSLVVAGTFAGCGAEAIS
jgi:hypothetical protein